MLPILAPRKVQKLTVRALLPPSSLPSFLPSFQAKVVASTVGPFARYGTLLLSLCAENGVDYCDITGETNWAREMIAKYDDIARDRGARVVCFCGHDSIPWDLSTYMLAKKLKTEAGESLASVDFYDDIDSAPSGGTLETAFGIMFGKEKGMKFSEQKKLGYDALMKASDGSKSAHALKARNVGLTVKPSSVKSDPYRSFFFMAPVNANTVKRSNALNGYGEAVVYCEGQSFKSFLGAFYFLFTTVLYGLAVAVGPVRNFMRTFYLPKPGQGPSEEQMNKGYLKVFGVAKGTAGTTVKSTMSFSVDPGYKVS